MRTLTKLFCLFIGSILIIAIIGFLIFGKPLKYSFIRRKSSAIMLKQCRGSASKERVNWNYFYHYENKDTKNELIWCKVPKAGSTTLTKLFLKLAGAKNIKNMTKIHKTLRQYYPRLSRQTMTEHLKSSYKFLIIRDPFERILSAYRDKLENYDRDLRYRDGYYYERYGKFMINDAKGVNSSKNIREPSFKEFVIYLTKTSTARYDEHWMPMSRLCSPCAIHYDSVIRMENMNKEMEIPLKSVGLSATKLGWAHKTGSGNLKILQTYFSTLSLSEIKKLYGKYKKDFQLFGYSPFKYFKIVKESNKFNNGTVNIKNGKKL